jgi:Family of unknown function (DUF6884)
MQANSRLLLLSCSRAKRRDKLLLPALERYDGPKFRVVRNFLRTAVSNAAQLHIYVLSARFGLIPADQGIPYYDQRLSERAADELRPAVVAELVSILDKTHPDDVYIAMGKQYRRVLQGYETFVSPSIRFRVEQGRRLTALRDWLWEPCPDEYNTHTPRPMKGTSVIHGIQLRLSRAQVLALGRRALKGAHGDPTLYYSCYVDIETCRVSPKWLVSQLTGLPVSSFHTGEAQRFLAALGVEVIRR